MHRMLVSSKIMPLLPSNTFAVEAPTISDFLTILAARERSHALVAGTVRGTVKRWLWVASAKKLLATRSVSVTPLHLSFSFKDTLVWYVDTSDQPQTKAQLEIAIAALGLAVPVLIGTLTCYGKEGID